MAVPNPYFIYIELFKADGVTRPNQNEIARVQAYDVNGAVVTWEGQSGFEPSTGGWFPLYMQNIAAFYPPREKPNLKFEVWNTQEQLVYTTQVFNQIPSASTVEIVIGVSSELVGGGSTSWMATGTVRHQDTTLLTTGTVRVYDITNNSEKQLGTATLGAAGTYAISFGTADFASNGSSHTQPNLKARVFDSSGTLLGESNLFPNATNPQTMDVTVPNETGTGGGTKRRVFGTVKNPLGLPVSGIVVEAYHVAWTIQGIQEFRLGPMTPVVTSDGAGNYEILYDLPVVGTPMNPCGTPADHVNLLVYAKELDGTTLKVLFTSAIVFDAPPEQRVDLEVNKTAVSTDSEYDRINDSLTPCLGEGATEAQKWDTLNKLNTRSEYLSFVAQATGVDEALLRAYVRSWLIAGEINSRVPASALSRPMSPEVIYALLRVLEATSLADLLSITPESFLDALVRAIHRGIVSASLEADLYPNPAQFGGKTLIDDWRLVLAKLLSQGGLSWQTELLNLVFPDVAIFPNVLSSVGTAFATDTTAHNVPMPATVVQGDLLVVLFASDGSATVTTPSDWTQLFSTSSGTTSPVRFGAYVKIAAGNEGGTQVNFVTSAVEQAAAHVYRVDKATFGGNLSGQAPLALGWSAPIASSGTTISPPTLSPSDWGNTKSLWLVCAGHDAALGLTSSPSGYSTPTLRTSSSASNSCTALSAVRTAQASSENPGDFVIAGADDWVAATLGVRGAIQSTAAKREDVVEAHFDSQGSFENLLAALATNPLFTPTDLENLRFVFELYERVGRYYPIVASVYAKKGQTGATWKTIQDLAAVPLEGGVNGVDWLAFANNSQSFSQGTFPADVGGNTSTEKARVYATRLFELFRSTGTQQAFASDVAQAAGSDAVLQEVATFLGTTTDFDLDRTNIDQYVEANPAALSDDAALKLKQIQRLYRITSDFDAITALLAKTPPLDSAVKIARIDEGQFIADFEQDVGGLTAARDIHRTATHYATEIMFTMVKYHQNLNEVGGMSAIGGGVELSALAGALGLDPTEGLVTVNQQGDPNSRKFPTWVTLFGGLNQCACKHCQTILSPGAYMVDLLEFVDGAPKRALFERRPDLEEIEITCTNTNTALPYIDLVNEVLEAVVEPLAFQLALDGVTPANIAPTLDQAAGDGTPAQLVAAIAKVSAALSAAGYLLGERATLKKAAIDGVDGREWVIEDDAWRFSIRDTAVNVYTVFPAPQTSASNDSLEVFPEHVNAKAYDTLGDTVFPFNLPLDLGREETEIFLRAKNAPRRQILEAFNTLSAADKRKSVDIALAHLQLGEGEATAILGQVSPIRLLWGFTSDNPTNVPRPDQPTVTLSGNWVALMALVPVFLHRSGLKYQELLELIDTEFVHRFAAVPAGETEPHGLHIAGPSESLIECDVNEFQVVHLTEQLLQRISVFVRLWRKLGWTMRDVDRYLVGLEANEIPALDPESTAVGGRLLRLSLVKRLSDELRLAPRAVVAFFRPMDRRRTKRNPKSLFDEVFLDGSPAQLEILALEPIARGATLDLTTVPADADIRAHVRAALRLKAEDIDLLWQRFVLDTATSTVLDIDKLTNVYRVATLAAALGLSVAELVDLEALIGTDVLPTGSPADLRAAIFTAHAVLNEVRIARTAKMPAAAMSYYLTDEHEQDDPLALSTAAIEAATKRLAAAAGEIASANPPQPNVDAIVLGAALAKVMPPDRVARALEIVATGLAPVTGTDRQFLDRYFAPLLPDDANAFFAELAALQVEVDTGVFEPDVPGRYARVFGELHQHLLEEARVTTAIAVAAELAGIDEDTASTLLTKTLSSTEDENDPALDDWKAALVGGWNSGDATLEGAPPSVEPRAGTFVASKGGEHRFVAFVEPTAGATVTISIEVDGDTVTLAEESAVDRPIGAPTRREITFQPVELRAGGAYPMQVSFTGPAGAKLTLLARVGNEDPVVVPSSAVVTFNPEIYVKLFKAAALIKGLALTKVELRQLVENPNTVFDLDALPRNSTETDVSWSALSSLLELLELNRSVKLKNGTLFEFWRDVVSKFDLPGEELDEEERIAVVAAQTGWKPADLEALRDGGTGLWPTEPPTPDELVAVPPWDDPGLWFVLRDCFRVIARLDIRARQILDLLVQSSPSVASALLLRSIFRAQFSKSAWKEVFKPLRDPLRQRQRDALIGYLTTRPIALPGGATGNFIDANDLFAHFMIDVEMEPDTLISRIKLALNAIQLFVHRVFLGLEDAASLGELEKKKDQWAWMEKFRVWEANRKVFLYPENWIEPDLRDDKTEFFTELEDELLQAPLTHETAMAALAGYLEKMNEVSNLEVVGSFAEGNPAQGTNFTLHVVGRTRSRSRGLFYRTFRGKQAYDGYWTPWKRINLEIDADVIQPVVVNGRLYLFWPKIITKERPREQDIASEGAVAGNNQSSFSSADRVQYQAEVRLMWSELNAKKNKWGKPKLSKSRGFDDNAPTPFQREVGEDQPRTENYHLRVHLEPMHIAVDLVKTNVPTEGKTIVFDVRTVTYHAWILRIPVRLPFIRVLPTAFLEPKLLGTFRFWDTGEDGFDVVNAGTGFGQNYPLGTVLKSNAAVEVDFSVDNKVANDTLQLGTNASFLAKTPGFFRLYETNFNYIHGADKQPFFYETNLKSLFALNKPDASIPALSVQPTPVARFSTFNHPLVQVFEKELQHHGLEGLMHRLVQALPVADDRYYSSYYYDYYYGSLYLGYHIAGDHRALYTTQRIFESEHAPGVHTVEPLYPLPTVEFGYGTSFGIYNWELFFHVPMLIAGRFSGDLKFEDALRWYHSVFDPKQELNRYERTRSWVPSLPVGCRYWNFLPFFSNRKTTDSLLDTLGLTNTLSQYEREQLTALIDDWRHTPFNPHLIARQRLAAYQKFTVMKYLDNLIAWADSLFRQDTFETINEATQLYILADELLGKRPEQVEPLVAEPRLTYRELAAKGINDFSNAIVEVESLIVSNQPHLRENQLPELGSAMTSLRNLALKSFYFKIPRNERLDKYWDTVADRLFKIRNSMNIDGVKRRLALFEPPIDPALLVRAAAAGLDIGAVLGQLNAPLPCYRFTTWIQKATELTGQVQSFGALLLAALEKKDGEELQLLRQGHELEMLELVRKVREQQVKEAEENITALELSRALAEERKEFYRTRVKVSGGEQSQIDLTKATTVLEVLQGASHTVSALFAPIPDSKFGIVGPFPAALVDVKIGTALSQAATAAAHALGAAASVTRGLATISGINAGYDRRWDDWKLQERLAQKEIEQLNQQIAVAAIRLDIAQKELENHEKQIEHSEEVREFLQDKFTSRELYNWMSQQLSRTYNQLYKLAYEAARTAERTFEFELGTTGSGFIQFGYVDSLRQGLLAGEKLLHDVKRMDVAFYERHKRELEIQKPISLASFDAQALQDLREKGFCDFELPEVLFDLDFAGHYFRRIKGVRLTIPCVTGPHTSVSAKLSLVGSAYRKEGNTDGTGANYAYKGFEDSRFVHDPVGITSIATGRAQGDPGLFEFNFRDERYLPFEGAGAISRWRLELPTALRQFDYHTISDVVMEVSYTARDAGGLLKLGAEDALLAGLNSIRELAMNEAAEATGLVRVLSLKKEFPDVFHRLLTENTATATLTPEHFPFVIRHARMNMDIVTENGGPANPIEIHVVPKPGVDLDSLGASFTINGGTAGGVSVSAATGIGVATVSKAEARLLDQWGPEDWTLAQNDTLTTSDVDDIVFIVRYSVA